MAKKVFERYPGSKAGYGFDDGFPYDAIVEPFAGSADLAMQMMNRAKYVFLADSDPTVLAPYLVWLSPELHQHCYIEIAIHKEAFRDNPEAAWKRLKRVFQDSNAIFSTLAAASLVLRKLTFGGVTRENTQGELNVTYCQDQLKILDRWEYRFPSQPKAKVFISSSWQECISQLGDSDARNALVLVDPPYYLPFTEEDKALSRKRRQVGLMTPAYRGHKPHDENTLDMCVDCVEGALMTGKVKRLIVTNYFSEQLDSALNVIPSVLPRSMTMNTRLDGLNQSGAKTTQNIEAIWEFGLRHQEQLSLLEMAV